MKIKDPLAFGIAIMFFIMYAVTSLYIAYIYSMNLQDNVTAFVSASCACGGIFAMNFAIRKE